MACTRLYRRTIIDNQKFTENIFYEEGINTPITQSISTNNSSAQNAEETVEETV